MIYFNVKDENLKKYLRELTDRAFAKSVKIAEHVYRNMPHLLLNIYDCDISINKKNLTQFLSEMPQKIDMKKLSLPLVSDNMGVCLLRESHISVHSFDDYVCVDIFSCKPYNVEVATNYTIDHFKPRTLEIELLYRAEKLGYY